MNRYVVGFAFNKDATQVLLITKNRPFWQRGHLNGIGGKIEKYETPCVTMHRECKEETNLRLGWLCKGIMKGTNNDKTPFECHIFYAYNDDIWSFKQMEDEYLGIYEPKTVLDPYYNFKIIHNLSFLLPFGIGKNPWPPKFIKIDY